MHFSAPPYVLDKFGVVIAATFYLIRSFARMSAFGRGDIKKAIIFHTIWSSNVRRLTLSYDNGRYDRGEDPPPAHLLQPISTLAIAAAMRMPYESVRRKVNMLKREGLCQIQQSAGVLIDVKFVDQLLSQSSLRRDWLQSLDQLIADISNLGFDFSRLPHSSSGACPIQMRAVIRIVGELDMQLFDIFAQLDDADLLEWFIIFTVWDFNIGDYYRARIADPEMGAAPDVERRPISVRKLAARIAMPEETTRRHLNALIERGLLVRPKGRGVIVSSKLWSDERHHDASRRICIQIARAMAELARQGAAIFPKSSKTGRRRSFSDGASPVPGEAQGRG